MAKRATKGMTQDGTYAKIEKTMKRTPTKIFVPEDIMKLTGKGYNAAKNALDYLWRNDRVFRHKERNEAGEMQYAISIIEDKRDVHVPGRRGSGVLSNVNLVRKMFETLTNDLMKLETAVVAILEQQSNMESQLKVLEETKKRLSALNLTDL